MPTPSPGRASGAQELQASPESVYIDEGTPLDTSVGGSHRCFRDGPMPQRLEPAMSFVSVVEPYMAPMEPANPICSNSDLRGRLAVPALPIGAAALGTGAGSKAPWGHPRMVSMADGVAVKQSVPSDGDCCGFRLAHVCVDSLQADNTLGLLLKGTSVVGFRTLEAMHVGWRPGDKIVEVSGQHVKTFDEFMGCFQLSLQKHGFPVHFSVLRREDDVEAEGDGDQLLNFFSNTDFDNMSRQPRGRRSEKPSQRGRAQPLVEPHAPSLGADMVASSSSGNLLPERGGTVTQSLSISSMEHPFVTALKLRRDALVRGSAGWAKWADDDFEDTSSDSVASRLAQRQDGVSTLHVRHQQQGYRQLQQHKSCSWLCSPNNIINGTRMESVDHELAPTPRFTNYEQLDARFDPAVEPPWVVAGIASHTSEAVLANSGGAEPISKRSRPDAAVGKAVMDDSELLSQLLLAAHAVSDESDEEDFQSEDLRLAGVQEALCSGEGSISTRLPSDDGDDFEILLPRKVLTGTDAHNRCALHGKVQASLLGQR